MSRAASVKILAHGEADFGGQNNFLPHTLQGIAHQRLAFSEAVYVRRVDEIDSPVQGDFHHPSRVLLTEVAHVHPAAKLHRAKGHLTHDEPGIAQFSILHFSCSFRHEQKLR